MGRIVGMDMVKRMTGDVVRCMVSKRGVVQVPLL